jgi:hypothetical protein
MAVARHERDDEDRVEAAPQRPLRQLDGEEQGCSARRSGWRLTAELKAKVAVYDRDAGAGGLIFSSSAVHSLTPFVHELAQSIQPDGQSKTRTTAGSNARVSRRPGRRSATAEDAPVGALGSVPTTPRSSITSASHRRHGLNGRGGDGSHHSTHDNPTWLRNTPIRSSA